MYLSLGKNYTIKDLNTPTLKVRGIGSMRDKHKIVIIDDEPFIYYEELRTMGFNIIKKDDITHLEDIEAYSIVISDIKGVGKKFSSRFEGAMLIRELKKKYPFKIFAAYTGSTYDPMINSYLEGVYIIKKDIEIDDWCQEIDALIKKVSEPRYVWEKIREILIVEEVSLFELAKLENEYVNIILNKGGKFNDFPAPKMKLNISADIRSIINSLLAGLILAI